jgi:hypothetical protein
VGKLPSGLLSEDEKRAWNARLDPNDENEQGDEDNDGDVDEDEDENEEDDDWPPSMLSGKFWTVGTSRRVLCNRPLSGFRLRRQDITR